MDTFKKIGVAVLLAATLLAPASAFAETVYYSGAAVSWDHGRAWGGWSYSNVQSGRFTHRSTANTTTSPWERPLVLAKASQWVGWGHAYAFWECRG